MYYLAIDPGGTTGWASFAENGDFISMGKIRGEDDFLDWLEEQTPKVIIIERYRNRGGFVNTFSDMPTSRHIGAIERIARKRHWIINRQDPSPCLVQGLRFLGMYTTYNPPGRPRIHVPDDVSALAHGTYFLRKAGVVK